MDRADNTFSKLVHLCVLGICCVATVVVYRVITLQRVYMLQYKVMLDVFLLEGTYTLS
jgi:hypothetical protein